MKLFLGTLVLVSALALSIHAFGFFVPICILLFGLAVAVLHTGARVAPRQWMRGGFPALLLTLAVPVIALAAEAAPETVAQSVSETTKVIWGWGSAASALAEVLAYVLAGVVAWAFRKLPGNLSAVFGNARVDKLVENAINYGLNAVKDATKGKTMQVDVGNEVMAKALQYALENSGTWLLDWAGGTEGLAKKIWGKLPLEPTATDAAVPAIVDQAS